jgi:hypothetical protein
MAAHKYKPGMIKQFLGHVIPGVIRPIHALWNEMIGFVFIIFAIMAGFSVWRTLRSGNGDPDLFKAAISAGFALLMAYFGITSFLKARKISRS